MLHTVSIIFIYRLHVYADTEVLDIARTGGPSSTYNPWRTFATLVVLTCSYTGRGGLPYSSNSAELKSMTTVAHKFKSLKDLNVS